ncbi:MAG TPA: ADP-ribosylglycohydrolase family protein, partial [Asanoa sp.]
MRVAWVQPEDLLRHELVASREEGRPVDDIEARWLLAGGPAGPPVGGATSPPAPPVLRELAVELLDELDARPVPMDPDEPDSLDDIRATWPPPDPAVRAAPAASGRDDRVLGAWLGRAAGCLLGKPVETIPRAGIREILEATGRWPLGGYFTAVGLPVEVARRWPWHGASRSTSLVENIDGMPEDDDMNYPLIALHLLETRGHDLSADDVATAWLDLLPAG